MPAPYCGGGASTLRPSGVLHSSRLGLYIERWWKPGLAGVGFAPSGNSAGAGRYQPSPGAFFPSVSSKPICALRNQVAGIELLWPLSDLAGIFAHESPHF